MGERVKNKEKEYFDHTSIDGHVVKSDKAKHSGYVSVRERNRSGVHRTGGRKREINRSESDSEDQERQD